ncbi:MAG: hypothetical protein WCO04_11295 [Pseudomonadota bacterium]
MFRLIRAVKTAVFICALGLMGAVVHAQTATTQSSGVVAGAAPVITTHTDVAVGAYVQRLSNVSAQNGTFDVDMWLWFRWKGADVRPDQTFEFVNGVISSRTDGVVQADGDMNYVSVRVQATIFHDFDVRRFPLDNHVIDIQLEDTLLDNAQMTYTVDEGINIDPSVRVSGWKVALLPSVVETHVYQTNYGLRSAGPDASNYSRLTFAISLDRTSYGPLFKSFWISALSVLLGLLAFLIKSDDLDARFGMGVGSIFAASANAFVITGSLPPTTAVTLAEQINLIAVGVIFVAVFLSIFSLRLRYRGHEDKSLAMDKVAMWTLGAIYIALNLLALAFDFSGGNG